MAAGLICEVLFPVEDVGPAAAEADAARGAGRFEERLLGGAALAPADGRSWAEAADEVARRALAEGTSAALDPTLAQAQRLAQELRIEALAEERSAWLPSAFARRLQDFAAAMTPWLDRPEAAGLPAIATAAAAVRNHGLAAMRAADECAVATLLRLGRWLAAAAAQGAAAGSFAEAAAAYAREGSYVDLARAELADLQGLTAPLAAVRDRLLAAVGKRRESEGKRFAQLLASWSEAPSETATLVPVESILDRVVAPLAASGPVLLLVLDGLSFAIFRALATDLARRGWEEITQVTAPGTPGVPAEAATGRTFGVGLLPTLTEVCRTSLFCGEPRKGTQAIEKMGFAAHPALRQQGAANRPPILFHKGDLRGKGAGLDGEMKDEIERPAQRVVGVVLNAVDDQLPKGGQLVQRWEVAALRPLDEILEAALNAGRAVVLTADHGHLVERGTELRRQEGGGARHRWAGAASPPVMEGEIAVRGPRVLGGEGSGAILPWSERLRYGSLQSGYHGGASPQEVIVPLSVWVPFDTARPGWQPAPQDEPAWWREDVVPAAPVPLTAATATTVPPEPAPKGRTKGARVEGQGSPVLPASHLPSPAASAARAGSPGAVAGPPLRLAGLPRAAREGGAAGTDRRTGGGGADGARPAGRRHGDPADDAGRPREPARPFAAAPPRAPRGPPAGAQRRRVPRPGVQPGERPGDPRPGAPRQAVPGRGDGAVSVSPQRRQEIIDALRRGTVPRRGLDCLRRRPGPVRAARSTRSCEAVAEGGGVFKAVRGEYGAGKTFFARWLAERAKRRGFAAAEVQISETETPLHRLETVYRRLMRAARRPPTPPQGALPAGHRRLVLRPGGGGPGRGRGRPRDDDGAGWRATDELLEQRLADDHAAARRPFAAALRGYRARPARRRRGHRRRAARLARRPAATSPPRPSGPPAIKGEIDHFGALSFLQGLLTVLRDSRLCRAGARARRGRDPAAGPRRRPREGPQRPAAAHRRGRRRAVPGPVPAHHRHAGLLRRPAGRAAAGAAGPAAARRLRDRRPLRQPAGRPGPPARLRPRPAGGGRPQGPRPLRRGRRSARERVAGAGRRRLRRRRWPRAVAGELGGQVGVAPRLFLKKLVADVLDRVDQFPDFDPRQHYAPDRRRRRADPRSSGQRGRRLGVGRHRAGPLT